MDVIDTTKVWILYYRSKICFITDVRYGCYTTDLRYGCNTTDPRYGCYTTDLRYGCYTTDLQILSMDVTP